MKVLFIHQHFPGQFKYLAPALVDEGHEVKALTLRKFEGDTWSGISIGNYALDRSSSDSVHPWLKDFEAKVIRGEACFRAAQKLKETGYVPDLIIAHHGWGESLFLKEVWPGTKLAIYCEFFYSPRGLDVGFEPEFQVDSQADPCRIHMKNVNSLFHINQADAGLSPTQWQADTFPEAFREKIKVCHDGIDTSSLAPKEGSYVTLNGSLKLTPKDQVITYVARNLEPLRGSHIFLRSLPEVLRRFPDARVVVVGDDKVGYGAAPPKHESWKEYFLAEARPKFSDSQWARIHFVGFIPYGYFVSLLQVSSVHVYLTYPFVLSWSLLEAMSAGCAVVASATPPVEEVIEDGQNGMLVDFFDHAALADKIVELLGNQEIRQKLGGRARKFAIENYDLKTVCLPEQIKWVNGIMSD
jgi:glycosyltransferase involved in cell wall biosynthesis